MPATSPEALRALADARIAEYYERKAAGVCVDCQATLPDDWDNVRCPEHAERARVNARTYNASENGRIVRNASDRARYERRTHATELGVAVCRKCGAAPMPGKNFCADCRASNTAATKAWRARKKQGITSIESARRRKRAAVEARTPAPAPAHGLERVVELDVLESPRVRLLRALRFFDWASARDLFLALSVADPEADEGRERDRYATALSRLTRGGDLGLARRRKVATFEPGGALYEYQITERGRAELARILKGSS